MPKQLRSPGRNLVQHGVKMESLAVRSKFIRFSVNPCDIDKIFIEVPNYLTLRIAFKFTPKRS